MKTQMIKLNLIPGAMPGGLKPAINVSQYDVGRPLKFQLYDGKTKAEIEEDTVITVQGTKPDKTGFAYACTWSGNEVTVATQKQMTVCAGKVDCELHLVKDTQEIGTANFILEVEPAALSDDTVISESEMPAIIEAARKNTLTDESVQTLVDSASAAASAATAAAESASSAAQSKTAAANSASEAAQSKTAAASSASAAAQSADAASTYNRMAYEYSTNAERSAESAARSAQQALENATGATAFSGSDPGLVPRSTKTGAFLRSDGEWADDVATDADMTALRTSLQTSFQAGVDAIYNACRTYMEDVYKPSQSTPSKIATAIQNQMQDTVEEDIAIFLPSSPIEKVTFYLPAQRLKSLRIWGCNRNLKINDRVVSPGQTITKFEYIIPEDDDHVTACKVELYSNSQDSYIDPPKFTARAYYSMYETDLPTIDPSGLDHPYEI